MAYNVGLQLKIFRKKKNYYLKDVSTLTGLSISLLSNIERGIRSPTIADLHKICKALGITINELLDAAENSYVLKPAEREVVFTENVSSSSVTYTALTKGERQLKGMCMVVDGSNIRHESFGHNGDEVGVIISGSMEMTIADEKFLLEPGDCAYIPAGLYHEFCKVSKEPCVSYWFMASKPGDGFNTCDT